MPRTVVAGTSTTRCEPSANVTTTGISVACGSSSSPLRAAVIAPVFGSTDACQPSASKDAASAYVAPAGAWLGATVTGVPASVTCTGRQDTTWLAASDCVATGTVISCTEPSGSVSFNGMSKFAPTGASSDTFTVIAPVSGSISTGSAVSPVCSNVAPGGIEPVGNMRMLPSASKNGLP